MEKIIIDLAISIKISFSVTNYDLTEAQSLQTLFTDLFDGDNTLDWLQPLFDGEDVSFGEYTLALIDNEIVNISSAHSTFQLTLDDITRLNERCKFLRNSVAKEVIVGVDFLPQKAESGANTCENKPDIKRTQSLTPTGHTGHVYMDMKTNQAESEETEDPVLDNEGFQVAMEKLHVFNHSTARDQGFENIELPTSSNTQRFTSTLPGVSAQPTDTDGTGTDMDPQERFRDPHRSGSSDTAGHATGTTSSASTRSESPALIDFDAYLAAPSPSTTIPTTTINWRNKLQEIFQERRLPLPVFTETKQAELCFSATVTFVYDGKDYSVESETSFRNKKDACKSAAKVAHAEVSRLLTTSNGTSLGTPDVPPPAPSTNINWKNKLQEVLQKSHEGLPTYESSCIAIGFVASVKFEYKGKNMIYTTDQPYPNKKLAENAVAKIAFTKLSPDTFIRSSEERRDFCDWHLSRGYPSPYFANRTSTLYPAFKFTSTVSFSNHKYEVTGGERTSKKEAELSAIIRAIEKLRELDLWDVDT